MSDSTSRAVDSAAESMTGYRWSRPVNLASAAIIGLATLAGGILAVQALTGCDPSEDGCRFVDDGQTWQTVDGIAWPVCPTEDATGPCVWDAHRDGNGTGTSFTVDDDGTLTYLP